MTKRAFAVACHPDDIEFGMAGTLLQLQKAGYEIHYMNIANGSLGTNSHSYEEIVRIRREEARRAAGLIGAVWHESLCDDLEVFYSKELFAALVPVIREVNPEIILTHGPYDYMEDHVNAGRLAVSAAFCRGMTNCRTARPAPAVDGAVAVYHSMPHSLSDPLRRPVIPGIFVDIEPFIPVKRQMLACHRSQKEWLDVSQGIDAYLDDMETKGRHFGRLSQKYRFAEGWVRHNPIGFGPEEFNPLVEVLQPAAFVNPAFEAALRIELPE
jgi:LmbE family N-acetylglucosaminyl deacetylase